jgi:hypothetical protein
MSIGCEVQGEETDKAAFVEAGGGDEVPSAHPRVVGDVGVAGFHDVEAEVGDEVLDGPRHRVHMPGRAMLQGPLVVYRSTYPRDRF